MTQKTTTRTTKTTDTNRKIKNALNVLYILLCVGLVYKLGISLYAKKTADDETMKNSSCPSLLSISRSARDTLIVMKAEPLCNEYVLETIK